MTVVEKGITQAYEIQRRLRSGGPKRAAVMGAGTIGLLAALVLRLRGLDVTVFGQRPQPYLNADLLEATRRALRLDHRRRRSLERRARARALRSDLRGHRLLADRVRQHAGARRRTACWCSRASPAAIARCEVPADKINLEFVLGNKVMVGTVNANREYFESGVADMAQAEAEYPGWLEQLLTHPVRGLDNYQELIETLTTAKDAIKVYCEVAPIGEPALEAPGIDAAELSVTAPR